MLLDRAVLPGEAISGQLKSFPTYIQKMLRKLVRADLITSISRVKGGFKLRRNPEDICVYDIYLAIEEQQSIYSTSSVLHDIIDIERETIASSKKYKMKCKIVRWNIYE